MTIAVGFRCTDGLVLCADRQISAPDYHKFYEQKLIPIDGLDWTVVLAYSGLPSLAKEARDKIVSQINVEEFTPGFLRNVCDDVLTGMGRQYVSLELQLLIGVSAKGHRLELLVFDGRGLHSSDGFDCLGVGDSSLIRYLSGALYFPEITVEFGENLATYLVQKAKKCIDHCGGETDIIVLKDDGTWYGIISADIWDKELAMDMSEKECLRKIIEEGSRSSLNINRTKRD